MLFCLVSTTIKLSMSKVKKQVKYAILAFLILILAVFFFSFFNSEERKLEAQNLLEIDFVCGVDHQTYQNKTFAKLMKVDVLHKGKCNDLILEKCLNQGGQIKERAGFNVCAFKDNSECEMQALLSGKCKGFNPNDFESEAEFFCVITGGTIKDNKCILECNLNDYLNQNCLWTLKK